MKLHYYPLSSYSQKTLMAFFEKEVEFTHDVVDFADEKQRDDYRKKYPLGKVPALTLDNGHFIPESSIIIEYLDTHFDTGTRLIPEGKEEARKARFQDRMNDLYLNDSITSLFFEYRKPENEQNKKLVERSKFLVDTMYGFMDKHYADNKFAVGNEFTFADCAAAPALFYAQKVHPYSDFKNIKTYAERLHERPSFKKVLKVAGPYMEKI